MDISKTVINELIAHKLGLHPIEVKEESSIKSDLGADSLDVIEITMEIEVLTSIYVTDEEIENVVTVKDIYTLLERKGVTVIN